MSVFVHACFSALAFLAAFFPFAAAAPTYRAPAEDAQSSAQTIHVLFGGDMMFDRLIRATIEAHGGDYVFSCIDPLLQSENLVVANLEGPITGSDSMSVDTKVGSHDNFVFTFPLSTAALLFAHHIGAVNLGNNHIENFGNDGVRSTIAALREAGVGYFGDPISQTVASTKIEGIPLALINYNEFAKSSTASTTIAQIVAARQEGEIPIVYTHWGIEYAATSSQKIHDLAHSFIDAGAEMVIGSHPHVVEEHEQYRGKYIYYSLGNFMFDQYWNEEVSHGLLLDVSLNARGLTDVREIPIVLTRDHRTCPQE